MRLLKMQMARVLQDTARLLVLRLHTLVVVAAGGFVTHSISLDATGVEVFPAAFLCWRELRNCMSW